MIDLHTHILPGMDDGAPTPGDSIKLLRAQQAQGVHVVVLTPHFYPYREGSREFLARRDQAWQALQTRLQGIPEHKQVGLPRPVLGAEVAWVPNLVELEDLPRLCIGGGEHMLLELPFTPWDEGLARQIYTLMERTGIIPVIAHLERYLKGQSAARVRDILALGAPVQLSADGFLSLWTRRKSLSAMENWAHVVASDCHDLKKRPPCLGDAMKVIEKKLGPHAAADARRRARDIIGEPE